jgi:hypothetical protein
VLLWVALRYLLEPLFHGTAKSSLWRNKAGRSVGVQEGVSGLFVFWGGFLL